MQQCVDEPHCSYKCVTVNHWIIWYRTFCSVSIKLSENTFTSIFRVEIEKLSANLKVVEEVSSETSVHTYQITVHHIAGSHNSGIHRCHKQITGIVKELHVYVECYLH